VKKTIQREEIEEMEVDEIEEIHVFKTRSSRFPVLFSEFLDWVGKSFPSERTAAEEARDAWGSSRKKVKHRKTMVEKKVKPVVSVRGKSYHLIHAREVKKRSSSWVWDHLRFLRDTETQEVCKNRVFCLLCQQDLSYRENSTGDLVSHLRQKNHEELRKKCDSEASAKQSSFMTEWKSQFKQLSSTKKEEYDQAILRFIISDLQPFSMVEGEGFKCLMKVFEPRYTLPSRTTISSSWLPRLVHETLETSWKAELNENVKFSITVDGWRSRTSVHYIGITAHYITNTWAFVSLPLDLIPLTHATNVGIADCIKDCLKRRNLLLGNMICLCTDGGDDISKVGSILEKPHVYCAVHGINLCVNAAVSKPPFAPIIAKVKSIVSHFRSSPKKESMFLKVQTDLPIGACAKPKRLKESNELKWCDDFDMVERFLLLNDPLRVTYSNLEEEFPLNSEEMHLLDIIREELKPIKTLTTHLQNQTSPIFGKALCSLVGLKGAMEKKLRVCAEPRKSFVECMLHSLESSMHFQSFVCEDDLHLRSIVFMDPRYKKFAMSKSWKREKSLVKELVRGMCETGRKDQADTTTHGGGRDSQEEDGTVQSLKRDADEQQFALEMDALNESSGEEEYDVDEVDTYLRLPLLDLSCCPLQWWQTNAASFPRLSIIARDLLCAIPTSVPSETLFSHAARVQEVRRCSLDPSTLRNLVLMNIWFREKQRRDEHPPSM
jgi:zinc finger BED domain-containing protein 1 (E3 SUMO-protein ligase ZBED1)